jgi:hypothetical protein
MYRHDSIASIEEAEWIEFSTGAMRCTYCKQGFWERLIPVITFEICGVPQAIFDRPVGAFCHAMSTAMISR